MTPSNGNIFRVPGPLCGEFTGHRWIPHTKASDAELRCFLWSASWINDLVNNREAGDLRRNRGHYDVTVMVTVSWRHVLIVADCSGDTNCVTCAAAGVCIKCAPGFEAIGGNCTGDVWKFSKQRIINFKMVYLFQISAQRRKTNQFYWHWLWNRHILWISIWYLLSKVNNL